MPQTDNLANTDQGAKYVAQIACRDELNEAFEAKIANGETPPFTIEELCLAYDSQHSAEDTLSLILKGIDPSHIDEVKNWKMVAIYDNNSPTIDGHTGMYACAIETGDHQISFGFRNSEAPNLDNLIHDWLQGDAELLNSELTRQQEDVEKFLKELENTKIYGENFYDYYTTINSDGHSLGGNLAMHAAVVLAEMGYADLVNSVICMDGPGNSDEYLANHANGISLISGKVHHYAWTLVGELLNDFPGVDLIRVECKDPQGICGIPGIVFFAKHLMEYMKFDSSGNFIATNGNVLAAWLGEMTRKIDSLPNWIGNLSLGLVEFAVTGLGLLATLEFDLLSAKYKQIMSLSDLFDIGNTSNPFEVFQIYLTSVVRVVLAFIDTILVIDIALTLLLYVIPFLVAAFVGLMIAATGVAVAEVLEYLKNEWIKMVQNMKNMADELKRIAIDALVDIFVSITNFLNSPLGQYLMKTMSMPLIIVDASKLTNYSQRLRSANRKLSSIEASIKGLYGKVGLFDLWNLMNADWLTGHSWRLEACCSYLDNTKKDFDEAEKHILSAL